MCYGTDEPSTLSEARQSQKGKCCLTPLVRQKDLAVSEAREKREDVLNGDSKLGLTRKFWKWIVVTAAHKVNVQCY